MLNALSARISIGGTVKRERLAVIQSKFRSKSLKLAWFSCEGTYSFIGNGVGKGNKITYAEAWKGTYF